MKKVTLCMAAAICILSIAGCNNSKPIETTVSETTAAVSETTSAVSEETAEATASETTALVEEGKPVVTFETKPLPETAGARADLLDTISEASSLDAMMSKSDCVVLESVTYDKEGAEIGAAHVRFTPDGNGGYNYDINGNMNFNDLNDIMCSNSRNGAIYTKNGLESYITIYPKEEYTDRIEMEGRVFLYFGTWPEISYNEYGEYKITEEYTNSLGNSSEINYFVNPETYEVRAIEAIIYNSDKTEIERTISTVIRYDYTEAVISDTTFTEAENGNISFTAIINPDTDKEETRTYRATADFKIYAPEGYDVYGDKECTQILSGSIASGIPETTYIVRNSEQ